MDATSFFHCRGTNDRFYKIGTVRFEKNIDFDIMLRLYTVDQIIGRDKKMVLLKSDKVAKYA